jgi:DNA polymerase
MALEFDSLGEARDAIQDCERCPLYRFATQAVFGAGPLVAGMMLVGEQPGDQEDIQGRPFVGPAGRVLDRALERAGIDRARIYHASRKAASASAARCR